MVFVVADIETAVLWLLQKADLNVGCRRLMLVEHFCGKGGCYMVDIEKVKALTSILEERSGLGVREAVARSIHYLDGYESYLYSDEVKYLLITGTTTGHTVGPNTVFNSVRTLKKFASLSSILVTTNIFDLPCFTASS